MSGHGMAASSNENRIQHFFPEARFSPWYSLAFFQLLVISRELNVCGRVLISLTITSPSLLTSGEQEIKTKELYAADASKNELTFGYAPRYSDYKYIPSSVHGDFRNSMNYWHLGRIFSNAPSLNSDFIHCDESKDGLNRIFAVETSDVSKHCWLQIYNDIRASRPMPKFGVPKII